MSKTSKRSTRNFQVFLYGVGLSILFVIVYIFNFSTLLNRDKYYLNLTFICCPYIIVHPLKVYDSSISWRFNRCVVYPSECPLTFYKILPPFTFVIYNFYTLYVNVVTNLPFNIVFYDIDEKIIFSSLKT